MPATNPAVDSDPAAPSSSDDSLEDQPSSVKEVLRKLLPHPSTAVMVKEALTALDSRKGVATIAIHNFIKQKYPSVDIGRAKTLIRKALNKGLENGTVVRPANSSDGTVSKGRFRLAPAKKTKPKKENNDPNVDEAKDGAKKPKKAGSSNKDSTKTEQEPKPPKKSKKTEESATKIAPAKKPKAKVAAAQKVEADSGATKAKGAVKAATKAKAAAAAGTKEEKATKSKAVKTGSGTSKAVGRQQKKAAE